MSKLKAFAAALTLMATIPHSNAQTEGLQIRDWNITPDIIKVFGMGSRDSQGGAGQYLNHLHTKEVICGTDTVIISAIGYSNRPGIEIYGTDGAFKRFERELDGNPDTKMILGDLFLLKQEEDKDTYHYCPQAL